MNKNQLKIRYLIHMIPACILFVIFSIDIPVCVAAKQLLKDKDKVEFGNKMSWQVGIGRRVITPKTAVWLAGWGKKRIPEGKIHDIWVKVLALKAANGKQVVMATTDHMGMSKTIYERLYTKINQRFGLNRSEFMITFSHNHSGPCLQDDLVDYYPSDDAQRKLVQEYSEWMEEKIVEAIDDALNSMQPARLYMGKGECSFAVNRRDNIEAEVPKLLAEGKPLRGVVDHYVPVLVAKSENGSLLGLLFGYACHPTTIDTTSWNGDYPGYAQINLESRYPGTTAMFFNTCGGDQNPIPRKKIELCEKYGKMLSDALENVVEKPMQEISPGLRTAFKFVNLRYDEMVTREKLLQISKGEESIQTRWAGRMLKLMDDGVKFPDSYPYPVQAWQIGELLLIGIGGEAVVDYSLQLKREYPGTTWVSGYTNDMVAYIPSRRVWEEGGYEGGSHLDEYGRPAWRWAGDIEYRIINTVHKVVRQVQKNKTSKRYR
ncbi:MAG: neutral/alkaline non-lysosomal ceramidase N-terminal domain-containing protein [Bacteroidetes bacterium]|nr:neutral/alkaline non-lysosomal ceramidase N-terminal domain-containing protein [Bacteroidota bacterium]